MAPIEFILVLIELLLIVALILIMMLLVILISAYVKTYGQKQNPKGEEEQRSGLQNLLQPERQYNPSDHAAEQEEG